MAIVVLSHRSQQIHIIKGGLDKSVQKANLFLFPFQGTYSFLFIAAMWKQKLQPCEAVLLMWNDKIDSLPSFKKRSVLFASFCGNQVCLQTMFSAESEGHCLKLNAVVLIASLPL